VVLIPSHEIFGNILIAQGEYDEAIKQFDLALQRAPNRSRSLLGKYNALKKQGQHDKAEQIKKMLMINWESANGQALRMIE
jgi:tetratricopeptide (TPR) repeat protein